jgi:hypothetical protein
MSVSSGNARRQFGVGALAFLALPLVLVFNNCQSEGGGKKIKQEFELPL